MSRSTPASRSRSTRTASTDAASHVTIEPKTAGRFEQHGRALAFVPDSAQPGTDLHRHGRARHDRRRDRGGRWTRTSGSSSRPTKAGAERSANARSSSPTTCSNRRRPSRPIIAMWAFPDEDETARRPRPPRSRSIASTASMRPSAPSAAPGSPAWARWSTEHLVPTAGPDEGRCRSMRASSSTATREGVALDQPAGAAAGRLVPRPAPSTTRPIQADPPGDRHRLLPGGLGHQDPPLGERPRDGRPARRRDRRGAGGADLGRTDADGLLTAATPAEPAAGRRIGRAEPLRPGHHGRDERRPIVLRPGDRTARHGREGRLVRRRSGHRYWLTSDTDRTLYRRTDTVNLWGVIRDRDTGQGAGRASTVRLSRRWTRTTSRRRPPMSTLDLVPDATGAFTGSVALADVPEGWYELELRGRDDVVGSTAFQVDRILKPAYRLEVETGHRAYVAGDRIKVTVRATFFEGSPVPGVPLRVGEGSCDQDGRRPTRPARRSSGPPRPTRASRTTRATRTYQEFIASARAGPRKARSTGRHARSSSSRAAGRSRGVRDRERPRPCLGHGQRRSTATGSSGSSPPARRLGASIRAAIPSPGPR